MNSKQNTSTGLHKHGVMRLRSVGRAEGQLTVAYEAWVQADVFGLRASACIRRGKQLAHNDSGIGVVVALMNFLSQSALQAWDVGGWRGLF
jgi:hypothetical protein